MQHVLGALAVCRPLQDHAPPPQLLLRRRQSALQLCRIRQQLLGLAGARLGPLQLLAHDVHVAAGGMGSLGGNQRLGRGLALAGRETASGCTQGWESAC